MTSRSTSLSILAAIAAAAALYLGQEVFVPIALGLMMTALVRPLVGPRIRIEVDISAPDCFAIADIAQFETALGVPGDGGLYVSSGNAVHGPLRGANANADGPL